MTYLLRLAACLLVLLSFNAKALVVNGCTIEPYAACPGGDLSFADLANADLSNANLTYVYLHDANLSGANLSGANFSGGNLYGANLSSANLYGSDLSYAHLFNAELNSADLTNAILSGAELTDAFYNDQTIFPSGFDPIAAGMINASPVPLPAGIYLFLSGLVGLSAVRIRRKSS
ncbi:VPLPA-CTERM sorting domain-containing protein [Pseudomonadales bacterium]|nr:VPLPA-CTERM sorting domain-containing protein [Pseudomonadales bacterium]